MDKKWLPLVEVQVVHTPPHGFAAHTEKFKHMTYHVHADPNYIMWLYLPNFGAVLKQILDNDARDAGEDASSYEQLGVMHIKPQLIMK